MFKFKCNCLKMNTNAYAMKVDCNPFDMGIFSESLKTQVANSANKTFHQQKNRVTSKSQYHRYQVRLFLHLIVNTSYC